MRRSRIGGVGEKEIETVNERHEEEEEEGRRRRRNRKRERERKGKRKREREVNEKRTLSGQSYWGMAAVIIIPIR